MSEYLLSTKYFQIIIFYRGKESSKPLMSSYDLTHKMQQKVEAQQPPL